MRRPHRFMGRVSEVELFRTALDSPDPPFSVLFVHGPGGIGKSRLLDVYDDLAVQAGCAVARLDGRDVSPAPPSVLDALGDVLEFSDDGMGRSASDSRVVLMLDAYERLASVDDWLRTWLLPRLPATAVTVIASRAPPDSAWRGDEAWRDLLRIVALRNLRPEETRQYLQACGVDAALHDRVVAVTHGHPLGLSLLTDVISRGGDQAAVDPLTPDLVGMLLRQFVDAVPSGLQRRALEVCSLARVTTEAMLRDVLEVEDGHEVFTWLRGLSFVESGPDGVFPHELARDAIEADLRWRDPYGYKRTFRAVRSHIYRNATTVPTREQQRVMFDVKFLFRHQPAFASGVDWESWGRYYPDDLLPGDHSVVLDLVRRWEGTQSADLAERWLQRQPDAFFVVRRDDGAVRGVLAILDLTAASEQDIAGDPGAVAAWTSALRMAPPRDDETVSLMRFLADGEVHQMPSPTWNACSVLSFQHCLTRSRLAWYFNAFVDPERLDEYFAFADFPRVAGGDFVVGDRRHGLFAHDFRAVPIDQWIDVTTERALGGDVAPAPAAPRPAVSVLSQPEFDEHVRQALRDLRRPERLARNPLLHTRMVQRMAGGDPGPDALCELIRQAANRLGADPRDIKFYRAVDRTFLRPAATQERAAEVLTLPLSTYKRHLRRGVDRIVADLWAQELHAPTG